MPHFLFAVAPITGLKLGRGGLGTGRVTLNSLEAASYSLGPDPVTSSPVGRSVSVAR